MAVNRPRLALLHAASEDCQPLVEQLRSQGWNADMVVRSEGQSLVLTIVVNLIDMRVPVESAIPEEAPEPESQKEVTPDEVPT